MAHQPRGEPLIPTPASIPHQGRFLAFGRVLQGTIGLPTFVQFAARLNPIDKSIPACHTLLGRPVLDRDDPMVTSPWARAMSYGSTGPQGSPWTTKSNYTCTCSKARPRWSNPCSTVVRCTSP